MPFISEFGELMRVAFVTFGCRLNRAEALEEEACYQAGGHEVVSVKDSPTEIVVRGCAITAKAQHDCEKEIAQLKARYPAARIRITGCLPNAEKPRAQDFPAAPKPDAIAAKPLNTRTARAYLKIQDGCNGSCAFCIVPHFRGAARSVPFAEVCAQGKAFCEAGYHEIVVTGCNLALYHDAGKDLADVLSALAELPHVRIRLGSLEPGLCDARVVAAFREHPNICRFVHLSLQSGSNATLKRMRRPYGIEGVWRLMEELRVACGDTLALGADVIAGFPGETEAEFLETVNFVRGRFSNLHVFPYSERPGTLAAHMSGAIPKAVRFKRAKILSEIGRQNKYDFARSFLGKTVEVCLEKDSSGWTGEYLRCHIENTTAARKSCVKVRVTEVTPEGEVWGICDL